MLLELSNLLFNRLGIIVLFAFILTKSKIFQRYIVKEKLSLKNQISFAILFGATGILATYWGIPYSGCIVNSRTIAIAIGGMIGGPVVGIGAGLIAGIHRMIISSGRFTAVACGLSTIVGGIIGGMFKNFIADKQKKWLYGFFIGFIIECIQMLMILTISKPFSESLHIVKIIFVPMTFINSIGISIFLALLQQIFDDREKAGAIQAGLALSIATKTLPFFRKGLNEESAENASKIIYDMTNIKAVSITDTNKILAYIGIEDDHHKKGALIKTNITLRAIQEKKYIIANIPEEIECTHKKCKLKSAIIVPLFENDNVIGTLKLYKSRANDIKRTDTELAKGLAHLFSTQIELSKIEFQKNLTRKAELKRLQAQIRPHFLFNTLNTVVSFCRTNPIKARELLLQLSYFLRSSFKNTSEFISLEQEIKITNSYLTIIKARFSEKIKVIFDVDENISIKVPPFILQPLVENAAKHGILPREEGGVIEINIKEHNNYINFSVKDNGIGIKKELIEPILNAKVEDIGIGVQSVVQNLKNIYNEQLYIESTLNYGTTVFFKIPKGDIAYD